MKCKEKSTERQLKRYKSSSEESSEDERDKKMKNMLGLFNFFIRFDDVVNTYQISFLSYFFVNNLSSDKNNIKNYFSWIQYELRKNV